MKLQSSLECSWFDEKLCILPSAFLFIGLVNVGPEFEAENVDSHAGPVSVFVATMFVYVVTFQLICVS